MHPILFSLIRKLVGKNNWVWPKYKIPHIDNINTRDNVEHKYVFRNFGFNASYELLRLLFEIEEDLHNNRPFCYLRMGDGEMYYLNSNIHGNLIKRHGVDKKNLHNRKELIHLILKCKYLLTFKNPSFKYLLPNEVKKSNTYDVYCNYQLVSSRILFSLIRNLKIGVIASSNKIELIKKLIQNEEYRRYVRINQIHEYIGIPEKNSGNNFQNTYDIIDEEYKDECDIYLVGIGISKMYVLPKLYEKYNKTFIDIGSGIDALAGTISNTRSYFGNWVNYKLKNHDYTKIDGITDDKYSYNVRNNTIYI